MMYYFQFRNQCIVFGDNKIQGADGNKPKSFLLHFNATPNQQKTSLRCQFCHKQFDVDV